jgi:hypothetical protein
MTRTHIAKRPSLVINSISIGATLFAAAVMVTFLAQPAAAAKKSSERFDVTLQIIEASGQGGEKNIDPKLKRLAKDLGAMPFQKFVQRDKSALVLEEGSKVSLEFPGAKKGQRRFLELAAHGKQPNGKLRFALTIAELKFNTLLAIKDGGTVVYVGPRHQKSNLIFVLTARTHRGKSKR